MLYIYIYMYSEYMYLIASVEEAKQECGENKKQK
jgi:hypothetical protein